MEVVEAEVAMAEAEVDEEEEGEDVVVVEEDMVVVDMEVADALEVEAAAGKHWPPCLLS